MKALFAAAHESESGPKLTWRSVTAMSAFRGWSGHPLGFDECLLMTLAVWKRSAGVMIPS